MPGCSRLPSFHVRLEADSTSARLQFPADDSCGAHLADVVEAQVRWAREADRHSGKVVVYAMAEGTRTDADEPPGPFDRLALSAIPVAR